jgi:hypothetical protein
MIVQKLISWLAIAVTIATATLPTNALAATDNATLKVGRLSTPGCGGTIHFSGYQNGNFGSYSPATLTGGETVADVYEGDCNLHPTKAELRITGFSVDPGQLWLTSITCNGVALSASSATYSYGGGLAFWSWNTVWGLYALSVGTNVSCSITHN